MKVTRRRARFATAKRAPTEAADNVEPLEEIDMQNLRKLLRKVPDAAPVSAGYCKRLLATLDAVGGSAAA